MFQCCNFHNFILFLRFHDVFEFCFQCFCFKFLYRSLFRICFCFLMLKFGRKISTKCFFKKKILFSIIVGNTLRYEIFQLCPAPLFATAAVVFPFLFENVGNSSFEIRCKSRGGKWRATCQNIILKFPLWSRFRGKDAVFMGVGSIVQNLAA